MKEGWKYLQFQKQGIEFSEDFLRVHSIIVQNAAKNVGEVIFQNFLKIFEEISMFQFQLQFKFNWTEIVLSLSSHPPRESYFQFTQEAEIW